MSLLSRSTSAKNVQSGCGGQKMNFLRVSTRAKNVQPDWVVKKTALLPVAESAKNVQWILMFLRFCEKWKMN
ncbi:hypothetical protein QHZ39_004277 [Salmonella enterica]|nr:hypothetical protein [Salmonella enterica]EHY4778158.1 hypothetical protein [Salmonella enterica]EKY2814333.1 hypothetical protein [Salmonella enterica]